MAESEIEKKLMNAEDESDIKFSSGDIEDEWEQTIKDTKSKWMMGVFGSEGTAKSGAVLDLRTDVEIEEGKRIAVIDIDESCRPLWESYWDCDPDIRIFEPVVSVGSGVERDVSYVASYQKVISIMGWLEENIEEKNIEYVVIDGIDTFLKWCELVMKSEDMGDIDVHNSQVGWMWNKRNERYYRVINWLKRLPVASVVTAHRDERDDIETGKTIDKGPNWHDGTRQSTADELYQIIEMKKKEEPRGNKDVITYYGKVHKWKGDIRMEGRKLKVLENKVDTSNNKAKYKWWGLFPKVRKYVTDELEEIKPKTGKEQVKTGNGSSSEGEIEEDLSTSSETVEEDEEETEEETEDKETEDEEEQEEMEPTEEEDESEEPEEPEEDVFEDTEETPEETEESSETEETESDESSEEPDESKDEDNDWFESF